MESSDNVKLVMSSITAGIIGAGGVLLAIPGEIDTRSWITAGITFALLAAKDIRTYKALPPVKK